MATFLHHTKTRIKLLSFLLMVNAAKSLSWRSMICITDRNHDQCNLAICHRYHNQCISSGNVTYGGGSHWLWYRIAHCQVKYTGCGTAWHIARLHWSWYRIPHCQVKYVSYGTTTSASHLAMCHMVPRPVYFSWHYVIWYHDQCISPGNVSYGTTTSAT
jgi:hypothetical protein